MFSLFLIILVSCIPFVVTWITSPEEIFLTTNEAKPKKIFRKETTKKLSKKGLWFIGAIVLTWVFAAAQFEQSEKDKRLLKNERDVRDSIITARINQGVDSNRKMLFNDLSEALRNQMLKLDTVNDIVVNLKDSSRFLSSSEESTLYIQKNGVNLIKVGNGWSVTFDIVALGSTLTNFKINISVISIANNQKNYREAVAPHPKHVLIQIQPIQQLLVKVLVHYLITFLFA